MNSDTLKKLGISAFIVILFVGYIIFQKQNDSKASDSTATATTSAPSTTSDTATSANQQSAASTVATAASYKDGSYTGSREDAFYGYVQVKATISGGKITDVTFVESPNDQQETREINADAMPKLKSEAITAQSANVDNVSGATDTVKAFKESLDNALNQAKA